MVTTNDSKVMQWGSGLLLVGNRSMTFIQRFGALTLRFCPASVQMNLLHI